VGECGSVAAADGAAAAPLLRALLAPHRAAAAARPLLRPGTGLTSQPTVRFLLRSQFLGCTYLWVTRLDQIPSFLLGFF